jgi:putative ABC transport system substrate-binding protein
MKIPRRDFITLLGSAPLVWPLAAHAQQGGAIRRIAMLMASALGDQEGQDRLTTFVETLQTLGWNDRRNVQLDVRWLGGNIARVNVHDLELIVAAKPDVIVTMSNPLLGELHLLTKTIPIVFAQVSDPVASGLVSTLARPGGNVTGFQNFEPAMGSKWLGLLKEAVPDLIRVGILRYGGRTYTHTEFEQSAEAIAPALGVQTTAIDFLDRSDIERGITAFAAKAGGGLIILPHPISGQNRDLIINLAARYRMPAIYPFRYFAAGGGLIAYGVDQTEQWRGAAQYVDRILKGEKPADLPVQAPTRFQLVINLKTAKTIGLNIPAAFPLRADEVIE